jgi:RimJ/RimL family protein N-acetyltransferase
MCGPPQRFTLWATRPDGGRSVRGMRQARACCVAADYGWGPMHAARKRIMLNETASIPVGLHHERFVAKPLTTVTAALDYASYMASPDVIRVHSDGRWPVDGFTLADDLELVAKHQADHENRRAFTFVILAPSRSEALGCLYVNPLREYLQRAGADPRLLDAVPSGSAMVTFWLRQDQQDTGLADVVAEAVNNWLLTEWPLATHFFRVLPDERSSCTALDRLNLRKTRLPLSGDTRPYVWYQP